VTRDKAREFVASNHRAVMITRKSTGGVQTSPVTVGIDSDGKVVISTRETAYKVRNLRRHPTATLKVAIRRACSAVAARSSTMTAAWTATVASSSGSEEGIAASKRTSGHARLPKGRTAQLPTSPQPVNWSRRGAGVRRC
jgi:hypothetical protein